MLRFLIFVPSAAHRPLHLGAESELVRHCGQADEPDADAFLIPQFGSAVLLNPPEGEAKAYRLTLDALDAPFAQFVEHFYQLLSIPGRPTQVHVAPGDKGRGIASPLSPWQLDTVLRTRLAENTAEAKKTLASMVRLIAKIEEMKVGAGVRDKILGAVSKLEGLPATARANSPRAAFVLSRDAVALANEAFFDPSMMGLLYFVRQHTSHTSHATDVVVARSTQIRSIHAPVRTHLCDHDRWPHPRTSGLDQASQGPQGGCGPRGGQVDGHVNGDASTRQCEAAHCCCDRRGIDTPCRPNATAQFQTTYSSQRDWR